MPIGTQISGGQRNQNYDPCQRDETAKDRHGLEDVEERDQNHLRPAALGGQCGINIGEDQSSRNDDDAVHKAGAAGKVFAGNEIAQNRQTDARERDD